MATEEDAGDECYICHGGVPLPPINSGCNCRNGNGIAHVACRARAAKARLEANPNEFWPWWECTECRRPFTGPMSLGLSKEWCKLTDNLPAENGQRIASRAALIQAFIGNGLYEEAEPVHRDLLETMKRNLGEKHPDVLNLAAFLAHIKICLGYHEEAEEILRKVLRDQKSAQVDKEFVNDVEESLADVLTRQEKFVEAEELQRKVLNVWQELYGKKSSTYLLSESSLGTLLFKQDKFVEAATLLRDLLEEMKPALGNTHPKTLLVGQKFALALFQLGEFAEAKEVALDVSAKSKGFLGEDHPVTECSTKLLDIIRQQESHVATS